MKLFHIISNNDLKIGKTLDLRDEIQESDYTDLNHENNQVDFRFNNELLDTLSFHEKHKNEIDNYKKEYLVITTDKYKIVGFIRI